jgi:hypothetical protein
VNFQHFYYHISDATINADDVVSTVMIFINSDTSYKSFKKLKYFNATALILLVTSES